MANYNLVTCLFVLLSVVAVVLVAPLVDFYGQINVFDVLSLRVFNLEKMNQEEEKTGGASGNAEIDQAVLGRQVVYPIVNVRRPDSDRFAPGAD